MIEQDKLEAERTALQMQKEQLGRDKDQLTEEKQLLKHAGAGKPPHKQEALAREIESIDLVLEQTEAQFQKVTNDLALVRIVDVLRRWPTPDEERSEREIEAEIRSAARDLDQDAQEIESILESLGVPERISTDLLKESGTERDAAGTDGDDTESCGEQPRD